MGNDSRHDYFKQDCTQNEPEKLATNSEGVTYYKCKNCNYFGTIKSFTGTFQISEMSQLH